MPESVLQGVEWVTKALEIAGAGALVLGFVIATLNCFRGAMRGEGKHAVAGYRKSLGRVVMIGLEILVAATILKTITLELTADSMALLAAMVAIRVMIGWTMSLEMNGRWPWQKAPAGTKP